MSAFNEVVAEWLRKGGPIGEVVSVVAEGSDWEGDTESGFYSTSAVIIHYTSESGEARRLNINGDDMASLWDHVMSSWPA